MDNLSEIKKLLQHGDMGLIAKLAHPPCTHSYVSLIFKGEREPREDIVAIARELVTNRPAFLGLIQAKARRDEKWMKQQLDIMAGITA